MGTAGRREPLPGLWVGVWAPPPGGSCFGHGAPSKPLHPFHEALVTRDCENRATATTPRAASLREQNAFTQFSLTRGRPAPRVPGRTGHTGPASVSGIKAAQLCRELLAEGGGNRCDRQHGEGERCAGWFCFALFLQTTSTHLGLESSHSLHPGDKKLPPLLKGLRATRQGGWQGTKWRQLL